jgi:hypothetical protein
MAALEAASGAVAAASALEVTRSYRLLAVPSLRRLAVGLWLLCASQLAAIGLLLLVLSAGTAIPRETFDAWDAAFWAYYGTLLVGLGFVFSSFGRHPFRWAPAVAGVLLVAGPALQLLTVLVLFFVVFHAGLNHIARKGPGSLLVAVGFFFLFTAHTLNLVGYTPLEPRWWPAALANLVGLLVLYRAVHRPRARTDG